MYSAGHKKAVMTSLPKKTRAKGGKTLIKVRKGKTGILLFEEKKLFLKKFRWTLN